MSTRRCRALVTSVVGMAITVVVWLRPATNSTRNEPDPLELRTVKSWAPGPAAGRPVRSGWAELFDSWMWLMTVPEASRSSA